MGFSYHPEGSAEDLWQHWGQLEGGGRAGLYDGKGTTPQGLLLGVEDTGNTERSTYVSRRIAVGTSRTDNDMVGTTQPRRPMELEDLFRRYNPLTGKQRRKMLQESRRPSLDRINACLIGVVSTFYGNAAKITCGTFVTFLDQICSGIQPCGKSSTGEFADGKST